MRAGNQPVMPTPLWNKRWIERTGWTILELEAQPARKMRELREMEGMEGGGPDDPDEDDSYEYDYQDPDQH